jgi:hypothetical protein
VCPASFEQQAEVSRVSARRLQWTVLVHSGDAESACLWCLLYGSVCFPSHSLFAQQSLHVCSAHSLSDRHTTVPAVLSPDPHTAVSFPPSPSPTPHPLRRP